MYPCDPAKALQSLGGIVLACLDFVRNMSVLKVDSPVIVLLVALRPSREFTSGEGASG